uniref:Peptidase S1 domain-containing protein n=1 Tax=Anopheles albimanus TaxID=7167 RepID=A0A182F3H4_ANOAL
MAATVWGTLCAQLLLLIVTQLIGFGYGELDAIESGLHEDLSEAFLPNVREAIDDCHLRYYKFGEGPEPKPAFGRPAYLREFAHMAAVGWTGSDGKIRWDCGGSLIWENYVLTAAHCVADDDNIPPDVVRLGDINLYDDSDDQYAQQLKIVEIVRHPEHRFSSRYHDLALLRLEKNVTLHDTVAPGCLWNDEKEIPFPTMEATGWGATGFGEKSTPILLKVSLGIVKPEECNKYYKVGDRGLKQGLMNYHLCAGDVKMDTCPGDSGGPLQMKLLHNGKMTPFVVAVTSFGSICGQSTPGVYMKVAPYIPWISAELAKRGEIIRDWSFKPYACALRYVRLREYEDDVVTKEPGAMEGVNPGKAHMDIINSTQTISIHWPSGSPGVPTNCYGVVIDEDTIVTLARCAIAGRTQPSHIMLRNTRNDIVRVHRHPSYRPNSFYNDIAILKVKDRFKFSNDFVPACIWSGFNLPDPQFYVTGQGRVDLNRFDYYSNAMLAINSTIVQLSPRGKLVINDTCSLPEEYYSGLSRGVTSEHLCFRNKPFLVPDSCEMLYGAPLRRNIWRFKRHFEHIYALNLLGKDCGFGRAALGTRLGYHSEWLKSVLLPNYPKKLDSVTLLNKNLGNFAHCTGTDGSSGLCVSISRCPKVRYDVQVNRNVQFCNGKDVVCCPYDNIRNITRISMSASELDDCADRYKQFHEIYEQYQPDRIERFYHTAYLGWKSKKGMTEWICPGTLITRSVVVSSAYCLMANGSLPTLVNVAEGNPNATWWLSNPTGIKEVIIHPGYNANTLQNNIGLVRLEHPIVPTARKYPICLWQNETHTPLWLYRMVADETMINFELNFPKYNSDCRQDLRQLGRRELQTNELCTDVDGIPQRSISGGSLVWYHRNPNDNSSTQYLVGIVSSDVPAKQLGIHVRISSFIGWIKSIV